ncbi:MAG: hypothetical protein NT120_03595 [Candidatus Aenigmarchaeota archaeon]|nr:hypothetical protein [Candidatus Aenigmarchaeota archaeon]
MTEIYKPKSRIAVASSFEGIVNDGAPECALVSFNAYHEQSPNSFFKGKLDSTAFNHKYKLSIPVKSLIALRPMVEIAEDYRTVLDLILNYDGLVDVFVRTGDTETYKQLREKFDEIKRNTISERDAFGKGKESLFYKEREALKQANYVGWLNTQEPYEDTLPQFRLLVETQVWDSDKPVSGFYPRFATSKDEKSTQELCNFYVTVAKLDPTDVGGGRCLIPPNGIIGMETVPSRNKVDQLKVISDRLELPRGHVWRLNDRYDPKQQEELHKAGFVYQFFLPGYATPSEIETAKTDGLVRTLDRKNFASQLAEYAREWKF